MDHQIQSSSSPHVLIFPLPALGHVTPALHLAELLCLANIKVTFLNSTHNHDRLTKHSDIEARFARYPGFEFRTTPDGLPDDHPRTGKGSINGFIKDTVDGLASCAKPFLRDILLGSSESNNARVTCMIVDGWMSFAHDLAHEIEIPVFIFRVTSATANWCYSNIPKLVQAGMVPFKGDEVMDELVKVIPGTESFLRYRDLPSFCRDQDKSSCRDLQDLFNGENQKNKKAHALILNTFEDLEGTAGLSHLRSNYCSRVYSIGPLHAHLKQKLELQETTLSEKTPTSLWEVDQSCIAWLDQKPDKSVIYVSFGSLTNLTRDQLKEFWAGLVRSKKYFLWVIRPNLILGNDGDSPVQDDILEGTKERGYIVGWVPQEKVLGHRAVGGFLTQGGWNSTLESIIAGVPMLSWPYFAEQQTTSRFASEVWKVGLDMKDTCDRAIVENMVNDLMDKKKDELQRSMDKLSNLAKKSISEGGSSDSNFSLLIEEIKATSK